MPPVRRACWRLFFVLSLHRKKVFKKSRGWGRPSPHRSLVPRYIRAKAGGFSIMGGFWGFRPPLIRMFYAVFPPDYAQLFPKKFYVSAHLPARSGLPPFSLLQPPAGWRQLPMRPAAFSVLCLSPALPAAVRPPADHPGAQPPAVSPLPACSMNALYSQQLRSLLPSIRAALCTLMQST